MLNRQYRISLAHYNKFDQKTKNNQIVLFYGELSFDIPKFAVFVPARFCRKAVARNKTKRLVWEAVAKLLDKIKPGIYKIKICDDFSKLEAETVLAKVKNVFVAADCLK